LIDIHSHILPGIDDGASSVEDAIKMAQQAEKTGVTTIIATPHHANGAFTNPAPSIVEYTTHLNQQLVANGISVTVLPGQEIRVTNDLLDEYLEGGLLTLAGSSYLLLEMPSSHIPARMEDHIHELVVRGLKPIIAHPERNKEVVEHPSKLEQLLAIGAYAQITSHSLLGGFGTKIEKHSWSLCEKGLIHLVANDAHNCEQRGFCLDQAYSQIRKKLGEDWESYFKQNANNIVLNTAFEEQPTSIVQSSGFLRSLTSFFIKK